MQFSITVNELNRYLKTVHGEYEAAKEIVPGNLVMHKVMSLLDVPLVLSHQATFKNDVHVDELLFLDLFQANNMIEYKVTCGRQLKIAGTIQLK
ncbi:hypothetical protein [Macrococcus equi]|uniref:hypothetical protein n=1 Tax=Macrococcus equi TaxID=3395462 RepID=UPI0039BDDEE6